ncbi:MAG: hypothetical protein ACE5HZ_02525 [Fidelibacterota bacterium]
MTSPFGRIIVVLILVTFLGARAGSRESPPRFEAGGGLRLLLPRQEYSSGWGLGLDGTWNLSRRYGLNIKYDVFQVTPNSGGPSKALSSVLGSVEFSFRRSRYAHGFTSLGAGAVSGEKDLLFVFGIGMKVPLTTRLLLKLELKDFFTQLGIPYLSFPGGFAALQGQGRSRYLQLGLGLNVTLGKKASSRHSPPGLPRK